jgi:hypothetical protein
MKGLCSALLQQDESSKLFTFFPKLLRAASWNQSLIRAALHPGQQKSGRLSSPVLIVLLCSDKAKR